MNKEVIGVKDLAKLERVMGAEAIIRKDTKVLLVQQRKKSAYGLWSFPGGHVEEGETSEDALKREIKEELNASLTEIHFLCTNKLATEEGSELELNTYICSIRGEITIPSKELMAYGWFSLQHLRDMRSKLRDPVILMVAEQVLAGPRTSWNNYFL